MKQKYLKKVEDIRFVHRDIANYFLEAYIQSKSFVDTNRDIQLRYCVRILTFSTDLYEKNYSLSLKRHDIHKNS